MNAELIGRLQASVDAQSAAVLMERLRASEDALLETARKERDQLASVVARFRAVLEGIERALASAEPSSEVANAQRDLEVIRAVIATVNGHS